MKLPRCSYCDRDLAYVGERLLNMRERGFLSFLNQDAEWERYFVFQCGYCGKLDLFSAEAPSPPPVPVDQ